MRSRLRLSGAESTSAHLAASKLVTLAVGLCLSTEKDAQTDHAGTLSDQGLDDRQVRYDDGDKGFSTCPSAARHSSFRTRLDGTNS